MDLILLKKTLIGVLEILTAGAFVYFGLQIKWSLGDGVYYPVALFAIVTGFAMAYTRG